MNITKGEAETYKWWSSFIDARMTAIQSMLELGRSEMEIYQSITASYDQTLMLIDEACRRQSKEG